MKARVPVRQWLLLAAVLGALGGCGDNTAPTVTPEAGHADEAAEVVSPEHAVRTAELGKTDPGTLNGAEVEKVLPAAPGCAFTLTAAGGPILVARAPVDESAYARGVMKIHGELIELRSAAAGGYASVMAGPTMIADGVRAIVTPVEDAGIERDGEVQRRPADLLFQLEAGLEVGYRGFYTCAA